MYVVEDVAADLQQLSMHHNNTASSNCANNIAGLMTPLFCYVVLSHVILSSGLIVHSSPVVIPVWAMFRVQSHVSAIYEPRIPKLLSRPPPLSPSIVALQSSNTNYPNEAS
jgi:hypothetical protein